MGTRVPSRETNHSCSTRYADASNGVATRSHVADRAVATASMTMRSTRAASRNDAPSTKHVSLVSSPESPMTLRSPKPSSVSNDPSCRRMRTTERTSSSACNTSALRVTTKASSEPAPSGTISSQFERSGRNGSTAKSRKREGSLVRAHVHARVRRLRLIARARVRRQRDEVHRRDAGRIGEEHAAARPAA